MDDGGWQPPQSWQHQGKTDATGAHVLRLDFLGVNPPTPMSVTANGHRHRRQPPGLGRLDRRSWSTPPTHYVGLRTPSGPYVDKGQPIELEAIDVDRRRQGRGRARRSRSTAVRLDWKYDKGKYVETEEDRADRAR
jgi:hypothetical protein